MTPKRILAIVIGVVLVVASTAIIVYSYSTSNSPAEEPKPVEPLVNETDDNSTIDLGFVMDLVPILVTLMVVGLILNMISNFAKW